jgi:hypothetical protein
MLPRENLAALEKDYEETAGDTVGLDGYVEHNRLGRFYDHDLMGE